jgi:hypothetical protein
MKWDANLPQYSALMTNIIHMTTLCVIMIKIVVFQKPDDIFRSPVKNTPSHGEVDNLRRDE